MAMTVLVLGGTGRTGRRVTDQLRARDYEVRVGSRSQTPPFDWAEPDTWSLTVQGAAAMYLMAPDGVEVEPDFVKLAISAGVQRIVLLSSSGIEEMNDTRLLEAEETVRGCGVEWTILRANWFN